MKHMRNNNLFREKQFGFLDGCSTVPQILVVLDKWTTIIDKEESIDCIYCDFKKAFDKVPHQQLLKKVKSYGILGDLLNFIQALLSDRTQQVVINGKLSKQKEVTSGIPQRKCTWPIDIVIFINDLPEQVNSEISLFADYTNIFRNMKDSDGQNTLQ